MTARKDEQLLIKGNDKMEFEKTKCKGCNTNKSPLFMRENARSGDDVWCNPCKKEGKHLE